MGGGVGGGGHVSYGRGLGITLGFSMRSQAIFCLIFDVNKNGIQKTVDQI